jgi:hypothetical protein
MKYKTGDTVVICSKPNASGHIPWERGMDLHCGNSGKITGTDRAYGHPIYLVQSNSSIGREESWWYQESWVTLATDYYWIGSKDADSFRKDGLEELKRQEDALRHKRDALLKKVFQND